VTKYFLRPAFTLVELIVVIGIVSILLGLLLAAVQRVRASVARTHCSDQLRQIGMGLHSYHGSRKTLPPGMTFKTDGGAYRFLSWNARVLPHLEHDAIWRATEAAFASDSNFSHDPPHVHVKTVVRAFVCAADGRAQSSAYCVSRKLTVAFTSYLGVEGVNLKKRDGLLYVDSRVRLEEITDGTSNTLLVGERPPSPDNRFGWWYAGVGQQLTGSGDMVLGVREFLATDEPCSPGPRHFGPGNDQDVCHFLHFWSHHSGGANFCFADGSVRFLAYGADLVLPALATRAGSETVELP
jgi:prepilin-type processing-associated H-X9-DG protein/prepilin-type N-terminal cleavage/methylation domain-containing protein